MPKSKSKKFKPATQRSPTIRKDIKPYLDSLVRLYEATDPAKGGPSQEEKLERARQAVSIWWYLYGELMLWAQSQIAGYQYARSNPEFVDLLKKKLGADTYPDSHVLEYIGLMYSWNRVNYDDDLAQIVEDLLEGYKGPGLDTLAQRRLIGELLSAKSANSSFWRFELQAALFNAELGQVDPLFEPNPKRRQGNPVEALRLKLKALQFVYFDVGKGMKKNRALDKAAEAIGQSVETLRSWEKLLLKEDDFRVQLEASRVAGEYEEELSTTHPANLRKKYTTDYHRHTSIIDYAHYMLKQLRKGNLQDVKKDLRKARAPKKGA